MAELPKRVAITSSDAPAPAWLEREREAQEHRKALRYFIKHQSSVGCYGGPERLAAALAAMEFFANGGGDA